MPIISSETLAQGSGSLLLKPGDTVPFFFVGILDVLSVQNLDSYVVID